MHSFINGGTGSGKTFLARSLAAGYMAASRGVIVLDPMNDPSWQCSRQFTQIEPFLALAKQATGCALFIDEAGQMIGTHPEPEVEWLATRARHWGHKVYFICQRAVQVKPTIRDQCHELYLFNVSRKDAESWSENFNDERLANAYLLQQYMFMHKLRFQETKIRKLEYGKRKHRNEPDRKPKPAKGRDTEARGSEHGASGPGGARAPAGEGNQ